MALRPGRCWPPGPRASAWQTGDGVLVLTELQRAGGKRLPVADFLRGFAVAPGRFSTQPAV